MLMLALLMPVCLLRWSTLTYSDLLGIPTLEIWVSDYHSCHLGKSSYEMEDNADQKVGRWISRKLSIRLSRLELTYRSQEYVVSSDKSLTPATRLGIPPELQLRISRNMHMG